MKQTVILGSAGSGKTRLAIERLRRFAPSEHRRSVRLIVPNLSQALDLRRMLLADPEFPGFLGDPICTLYEFAKERLGITGRPIAEPARTLLLARILTDFPGIKAGPGTPFVLASTIRSLERAGTEPEALPGDLSRIYRAYLDALAREGLHTREGLVSSLVPDADLPGCIIIDGFSEFSPVERRLVSALADRANEFIVTSEEPLRLPRASVKRLAPRDARPTVRIARTATPLSEVETCAREIVKLGISWNEICITARDIGGYAPALRVLADCGIPCASLPQRVIDTEAGRVLREGRLPSPAGASPALASLIKAAHELPDKEFAVRWLSTATFNAQHWADGVIVTGASGLGARKYRALFVLGATQGAFPRSTAEDPFLPDEERKALGSSFGATRPAGSGGSSPRCSPAPWSISTSRTPPPIPPGGPSRRRPTSPSSPASGTRPTLSPPLRRPQPSGSSRSAPSSIATPRITLKQPRRTITCSMRAHCRIRVYKTPRCSKCESDSPVVQRRRS
ncbi:MAG: PD-(D/E)XK nuclease family protein [Armatimonadota bacterium]